jgi:hypothetical protein
MRRKTIVKVVLAQLKGAASVKLNVEWKLWPLSLLYVSLWFVFCLCRNWKEADFTMSSLFNNPPLILSWDCRVRSCSFSPPVILKILGLYFTVQVSRSKQKKSNCARKRATILNWQFDIHFFLASFNIGQLRLPTLFSHLKKLIRRTW